jgi:triosephosphate isomerase
MLAVMRTRLIAGNWKMHKLPSDAVRWTEELVEQFSALPTGRAELLLNVPFTHLVPLADTLRDAGIRLGAQDLSSHDQGAFTGEVSGAMLRDAGADYVLVGHSERRQYHHETDELVNLKVRAAQSQWLVPIICVGESAGQRDAGEAADVVLGQLELALAGIELASSAEIVIAYEPVWSIGTGRTATAADAQAMSADIRNFLRSRFPSGGGEMRILYGGSMNPLNAAELLAQEDIDGGLIGGASLEVTSLLSIFEAAL